MAMRDSYQQKMAARAGASYYGNRALSADEMGPLTGARVHAMANLNRASGGRIHYYDGNGDCKMIAGSMRDDATGMPCSEYYGNLEGAAYDQCLVKLGKATGSDGSRMPISQRKSICKSQ